MDKKSFIAGLAIGKTAVILGLVVVGLVIKKSILDPMEEKEKMIDYGRKRAPRKRIAP